MTTHDPLSPGQKLRLLMKRLGITQQDLADVMNVHRGTVAAYVSRPNASPSADKIRLLSARFGVPLGWFYDGAESDPPVDEIEVVKRSAMAPSQSALTKGMIILPVWSAAAGFDGDDWSFDETEDQQEVPMFLCGPDPENVRVIRVRGASMAPRIPYGSQVLVHLQSDLIPNEIGVFQNPAGRLQIKVFSLDGGQPVLRSLNAEYPPVALPEAANWAVRAGVITIMRPYDEEDYNIEYNDGRILRARRPAQSIFS